MKLKLTLALVACTPTMLMAQAMVTDKPVIAPPEIVKESVITRPGEGVSGVYKPAAEPAAVKPAPAPAKPAAAERGTYQITPVLGEGTPIRHKW